MSQQSPYRYRAFGLTWQSALPLPELREDVDSGRVADVIVSKNPADRPDLAEIVPNVRADATTFWMEVPGVVRLLVQDGRDIVVEPLGDAAPGDVRAYLLGSAVGAVLHQRGVLPLHGSAVVVEGRAIVFVAPSGGGKSTMAMHLQHLGHPILCDDICAIDIADGVARVSPGLRNLKLWRASLDAIDAKPDGFEPVLATMDKYRVPVTHLAEDRDHDIAAVIELDWSADAATLAPLPGAAAVGTLVANTFRGTLVAAMGREAVHWRQCLALFGATPVGRLARPRALGDLGAASALAVQAPGLLRRPVDVSTR